VLPGGHWTVPLPKNRPEWLCDLNPYPAHSQITDESVNSLDYQVILGGDYMNELRFQASYFDESFGLVDTLGGWVRRGKFHSGCSNYPPTFARIKINKITQKSKKKEKAEDKSLDEKETYIPDEYTGISEDELNRLLYQHAQMDQIQLLENIKENKLDAQAELEKYMRENLSRTPDG
jgi:hypothetical protein